MIWLVGGRKAGEASNDGGVREVVDGFIDGALDEVREELRDILTELEVYQRTWIVPWFVQRLINDLHMRVGLLLDKLGRKL